MAKLTINREYNVAFGENIVRNLFNNYSSRCAKLLRPMPAEEPKKTSTIAVAVVRSGAGGFLWRLVFACM
ncbi:Uncharacterised protein [Sphingobacterium thalpophilum]|uniref:Uncharacterized protein n=1 Tax=Sphingobacterium thalpophilum TaxID=259 RepID=A0A4U9W062_9SPHI|nr:Uncharacterised protein [Sphingobacterium thalpophilum]